MAWKNERRIESPYENWPGWILVPQEMDAELFSKWWEKSIEREGGEINELTVFKERHVLVLDAEFSDPDGTLIPWESLESDGSNLPTIKIATFVISSTQVLLTEARSLPKSPTLSSNGTPLKKKRKATRAKAKK